MWEEGTISDLSGGGIRFHGNVECKKEESEQVKQVLKESMENATKLSIPLKVEISEANNWYEAK